MRRTDPHDDPPPKRTERAAPGPVPTLAELTRHGDWVWLNCASRSCHHSAPLRLAVAVAKWGPGASSDVLRRKARCSKCGDKGVSLALPSHVDSLTGTAPFPGAHTADEIVVSGRGLGLPLARQPLRLGDLVGRHFAGEQVA